MKKLVKPLRKGKEDQMAEALMECSVCIGDTYCGSGDNTCDYESSDDSSDDILF